MCLSNTRCVYSSVGVTPLRWYLAPSPPLPHSLVCHCQAASKEPRHNAHPEAKPGIYQKMFWPLKQKLCWLVNSVRSIYKRILKYMYGIHIRLYCKDPWIPLVMYHQDLYKERMVQDVWQWRLCPGENCSFWVWQRQRLTIGTVAEWSKWAECPRKLDRLLLSRLLMCQNVMAVANLITAIIIILSMMLIIMKFEARISG